jgi:hypothetical protein
MALQQNGHTYFDEQSFAPFAVIDEVVRSHEPEFAALGFTLKNVMLEGPPPAIVFQFSNAGADRFLDVSSFLARTSPRRGFSAMISTAANRKLSVHDYLVRHGRSDIAQMLTDDAPSDVRAFAESSVRLLLDLLNGELKPVVDGKTFEETPIDWAGYK